MQLRKKFFGAIVGMAAAIGFSLTASAENVRAEISPSFTNTNSTVTIDYDLHSEADEKVLETFVFVNGEGRQVDPSKTSFTIDSLNEATEYKLNMMSVFENTKTGSIRSTLSENYVVCTSPSDTTITKHAADSQSIELNWKKIPTTEGYILYFKDSSGNLTPITTLIGADNVKYTVNNLKRNTSYTVVIKTYKNYNGGANCIVSRGTDVTEKTLDHPEASTSKDKAGIIRINSDTKTIPDKNGAYQVLRRGLYTGYRISDVAYKVSCGYGEVLIPYSNSNVDVVAVSSNANSILTTGAISQLGQGISYPNGCGPTAANILIAHELFIPNGDASVVNKNTIISNYRYDSRVGKFAYGQYWCISSGTKLNTGVKVIVDDYAKKYGKKAVYFDTASVSGYTFAERQSKVIAKIDSELAAGHRILACVKHRSDDSSGVTTHNYLGAYTHYVVICAETGDNSGKYYIADPYYSEKNSSPVNGGMYYYGLEERSKSEITQSIMSITDSEIRGLVFIS